MGTLSKKLVTVITAIAVVTGGLINFSNPFIAKAANSDLKVESEKAVSKSTASMTDEETVKYIEEGVILHAWCWSFNTIKANLQDIADAGYHAVQVIPPNECFNDGTGMAFGKPFEGGCWYFQYQPTDFKIGNYIVGTRDEFKSMCEAAEDLGIKIIVDVVANHTTEYEDKISSSLYNISGGLYHSTGHQPISSYSDRFSCTNQAMCNGGLPDINTENKAYQEYLLKYLQDCIDCGADGFRYDAAKHIGLPGEAGGGDFWPTILNGTSKGKNLFQYGEVLQGDNENMAGYAQYMKVTASNYGGKMRGGSLNAGDLKDYSAPCSPDRLVTWVESHDNYCNDGSNGVPDDKVRRAWAVLAARKETTPLFFSRPQGGGPSNKFPEISKMGDVGSDAYKHPEVAAVNNFRNAMAGEDEKMTNQDDTLVIERGNKGIVIINGGGEKTVNIETSLPDGEYKEKAYGETFTVSGGKITGKIKGGAIATIYEGDSNTSNRAKVSASVNSGSFKTDYIEVKLSVSGSEEGTYTLGNETKTYKNDTKIKIGEEMNYGDSIKLTLKATGEDGKEVTKEYTYTKQDPSAIQCAYLKMPSGWSGEPTAYIYDLSTDSGNDPWPGKAMTKVEDGLYSLEVPDSYKEPAVIFVCGTNRYPADKAKGLSLEDGKSMVYDGTDWKEYVIKTEAKLSLGDIEVSPKDSCNVNDTVTISVNNVSGGSGDYSYDILVDGKSIGKKKTVKWTPDKEGNYTIKVVVSDSKNASVNDTIEYEVKQEEVADNEYTIITKYLDEEGNLLDSTTEKVKEGEKYTTKAKEFDGYVLKTTPSNAEGTATKNITVTYKYTAIEETTEYVLKYIDFDTKESLTDDETVTKTNIKYSDYVKEFKGYEYYKTVNTKEDGKVIVKYYYKQDEVIEDKIVIDSFDTNIQSPQVVNTKIKLQVSASGIENIMYQYYITDTEGNVIKKSNRTTRNYYYWTPTKAGTYKIYVVASDADNADNNTTSEVIKYTISEEKDSETEDTADNRKIIPIIALLGMSLAVMKKYTNK